MVYVDPAAQVLEAKLVYAKALQQLALERYPGHRQMVHIADYFNISHLTAKRIMRNEVAGVSIDIMLGILYRLKVTVLVDLHL